MAGKMIPHIFCDLETMAEILNMDFDKDNYADYPLTLDIIDIPYWFLLETSANGYAFKAYQRGDLHGIDTNLPVQAYLNIDKALTKPDGSAKDQFLAENLVGFFQMCINLGCYLQENGMADLGKGIDFTNAASGIMLENDNGEIKARIVSGRERPELLCFTNFGMGEPVMCRPYMEDFMERSRYEEMSIEELEKEAESSGDINIMDLLSHIYSLGDDRWETDQDPVKAVYWMRKMAEAGNPTGMFNLALHYAKGYGIEQSFEKAADWMEKAAESGDEDAIGNAKVLREAAEAYPKAKAGDVHAQAVMAKYYMTCANMLEESNTEEEYFAKALECAKASAAQNDTLGIYILALAYDKGRGVKEDIQKGLELYRKGAELGGVECLQNLAYAYLAGRGVKQDAVKGFELSLKAAEQGSYISMCNVANAYKRGVGVGQDLKAAAEWYEKALETHYDPDIEQQLEGVNDVLSDEPMKLNIKSEQLQTIIDECIKNERILNSCSSEQEMMDAFNSLSPEWTGLHMIYAFLSDIVHLSEDCGESLDLTYDTLNVYPSALEKLFNINLENLDFEASLDIIGKATGAYCTFLCANECNGTLNVKCLLNEHMDEDEFHRINSSTWGGCKVEAGKLKKRDFRQAGIDCIKVTRNGINVDFAPVISLYKEAAGVDLGNYGLKNNTIECDEDLIPDDLINSGEAVGSITKEPKLITVNVFSTLSDFLKPALAEAKNEQLAGKNNIFSMQLDPNDLFEIAVDDIALPARYIVNCAYSNVTVKQYTRDEERSLKNPIKVREFKTVNGKLEASLKEVQTDNTVLFAFAANCMRNALAANGQLEMLEMMGSETTGVMLTFDGTNTITKIVTGLSRPNLPCAPSGMEISDVNEAVMMRPYEDEIREKKEKEKKLKEEAEKRERERKEEEERKKRVAREEEAKGFGISVSELDRHKAYLKAKDSFEKAKTEEDLRSVKKELEELNHYRDSDDYIRNCDNKLKSLKSENERQLNENKKLLVEASNTIAAGPTGFAFIRPDGTVSAHCDYRNSYDEKARPDDVSRFRNIKKLAITDDGIVGLQQNGDCICTRISAYSIARINECNSWREIKDIAAGDHHIVGLKKDGTCVSHTITKNAVYGYHGECDVQGWANIVQISCTYDQTVGLRSDGTVRVAGRTMFSSVSNAQSWRNIKMIATGYNGVVGLTNDNKIVGVNAGTDNFSNLETGKEIFKLAKGSGGVYALYTDGTVRSTGRGDPEIKQNNIIDICSSGRAVYILTEEGKIFSIVQTREGTELKEQNVRVFQSFKTILKEREDARIREEKLREEAAEKQRKEEKLHSERRDKGVCQYCGGEFKKGLFGYKCSSCGKKKDY